MINSAPPAPPPPPHVSRRCGPKKVIRHFMASALQTRSSFILNRIIKEVVTAWTKLEHLSVIRSCPTLKTGRFISSHDEVGNTYNQSVYNPSDASKSEPGRISISASAHDANGNLLCRILVFHCLRSCSLPSERTLTRLDAGGNIGALGEGESDQQSIDPLRPAASTQIYLAKCIHISLLFSQP